jgi:VCBS repeat-containing protein
MRIRTFHAITILVLLTLILAQGIQVGYASAPSATTLSPTNVTATSATLRGSVNPHGKSTIVDFASGEPVGAYNDWGISPSQNIGSGTSPVLVTYSLTGLIPATEYKYNVRASNADGSQNGAVVTFHTLPAAVSTDWAVISVNIQPPSPSVGDHVALRATVEALSTNGGYPQSFIAQCTLDGSSCGSGSLSYAGPTGVSFTVYSQNSWTATAGTHTLNWQVSTTNDPNPGNNFGSYTFSVAAPTPFDFEIVTSANSLTLQPGQTQSTSVDVNLKSGTAQEVSLAVSGQPSGVTAYLNPTSDTPTFSSTLTIAVSSTASPGTYTLTIAGSGGGQSHSASLALIISQAPDFRIDVNPASQSVAQGQTASYSVSVVGSSGFNSQVSLSVSGLPSGTNGVFTVNSGTPDFSATLTVTLPSDAPVGSFALAIKGTGGGLERTANVVLVVTAVVTQTQTTTQIETLTGGGVMEILQQNSLLIIAALIILVIIFGGLAMRSRGRQPIPQQGSRSLVFCSKCGTENPSSNEFCSSCGNRLRST